MTANEFRFLAGSTGSQIDVEETDKPLPTARKAATTGEGASETANERAYLLLKQAVLAGGFRPGEVVTLRALRERLALGDTPVREAVKRLVSEGAFEGMPNRSARVPVLSQREIQQVLALRILLESDAAALAAQNITLHHIEQLRGLHAAMGAAIAADDGYGYGELNMAFHFQIYRIADNRTLATLIEALWLRMAPFVSRTRTLITGDAADAWRKACGQHEALLTAFQNRDAEAARRAMRDDLSALSHIDGYWDGIET